MSISNEQDKSEILAPAGSFSGGVYAFRSGADAVYLGLPHFSARKNARNCTLDELAKLRNAYPDKKIYVAANTVIKEDETRDLLSMIYRAWLLGIDAVIVQDYGLLTYLKNHFPGLRIHASTQMAVHNTGGVRILASLGVSRVILARELTLEEIRSIRKACPETELEVFVHGALCFSFSGLCLASGILLGRSGNRGECAQICRTWFETKNGERGYFFSTNDNCLGQDILMLRDAGITSFKIEGRMKSPEYAGTASAYYRAVLDGLPETVQRERLDSVRTIFSRKPVKGFFRDKNGEDMLNPIYPSHLGIPLGKVVSASGSAFDVKLETSLSVRDGILFFTGTDEPVVMSVSEILMNGRGLYTAAAGNTIRIPADTMPARGKIVRKVSNHDSTWPETSPVSFRPMKIRIPVNAVLTDTILTLVCRLPLPAGLDTAESEHAVFTFEREAEMEGSRTNKEFFSILSEILRESGDYPVQADLQTFRNSTGFPDDGIFIRPSSLKRIRQEFYKDLNSAFTGFSQQIPAAIVSSTTGSVLSSKYNSKVLSGRTPPRNLLIPKNSAPVPFVTNPDSIQTEDLPVSDGVIYFPLSPVSINETAYLEALKRFICVHTDAPILIGLNNASHLQWVHELTPHGHIHFFIDYGLYCANLSSYLSFLNMVPRLAFVYYWIEGSENDFTILSESVKKLTGTTGSGVLPELRRVEAEFRPPLFMSRICVRKHAFGIRCPECLMGERPEAGSTSIQQNGRTFEVAVRECFTYVFSGS